jgi:hypothetical protein
MSSLASLLVVMELVQMAWVHRLRAGIPSVDEQEVMPDVNGLDGNGPKTLQRLIDWLCEKFQMDGDDRARGQTLEDLRVAADHDKSNLLDIYGRWTKNLIIN